jgi:hypothetical protein
MGVAGIALLGLVRVEFEALACGAGMHRHFLRAAFSAGNARFAYKPTPKNCQDGNFGTGRLVSGRSLNASQ